MWLRSCHQWKLIVCDAQIINTCSDLFICLYCLSVGFKPAVAVPTVVDVCEVSVTISNYAMLVLLVIEIPDAKLIINIQIG